MIKKGLIVLIRFYQLWPKIRGRTCRFEPTCSQYVIDAIMKYGIFIGSLKGMSRIMKCHPFHSGGYDPA